ncbi:MAG: protein kinase [Candidatus Obscuribacterales bacterium]|nr:protein kinase [Candidatus Obscuribacterales bacterium]
MSEKETCPKCKKQKSGGVGGFVTQFIDICTCDTAPPSQEETIVVCARCAKRIPTRAGSITQWVFKEGTCSCDRPEPVERVNDNYHQPVFEGYRSGDDEEVLNLAQEDFPVERFAALAELGRGASGIVYLCRDKVLGKKVAVKTLLHLEASQIVSFQDEARATARLNHPNIVTVLDFGVTDSGIPYMVMDHVPGISLEQHLQESGPLEEGEAARVFSRIARALSYAHKQKIFHRDLKPSNIILPAEDSPEVRLIDFGIAKVKEESGMLTMYQEKTLAGTPKYMSPDPMRGDVYDARSEIYSLGCVLFEALTGSPPFTGETPMEILSKHANNEAPELNLFLESPNERMDAIVSMCLRKSRDERYQSMEELAASLESFSTGTTPIDATIESVFKEVEDDIAGDIESDPASKNKRTNAKSSKWITLTAIIAVLGVAAAIVLVPGQIWKSKKNPEHTKKVKLTNVLLIPEPMNKKPTIVMGASGTAAIMGTLQTPSDLAGLVKNKRINELEISDQTLKGDMLRPLNKTNLKNLVLRYDTLDRGSIASIASIGSLESLHIGYCELNPSALEALEDMKNLKGLVIRGVIIDERLLSKLATLDSITTLDLCDCDFGKIDILTPLVKLPALKEFNLSGSKFDNAYLQKLKEFPNLKSFEIGDAPPELAEGLRNSNIDRLTVSRNKDIKEDDLLFLAKEKNIKLLIVRDCGNITQALIKKYNRLNPRCRVVLSHKTDLLMRDHYLR